MAHRPGDAAVTPADVAFRPAEPADAPCLSALATQVFFETYATSGIRIALVREAASQFSGAAIAERLCRPEGRTTLAERDGHLIAFAEIVLGATHPLVPRGDVAELTRLYVQAPFLRRGIGRRLLAHAETLASAEGASTLWLTAWIGNARALAFYASQGYAPLGSTPHEFEGEVFENTLFAKRLAAARLVP